MKSHLSSTECPSLTIPSIPFTSESPPSQVVLPSPTSIPLTSNQNTITSPFPWHYHKWTGQIKAVQFYDDNNKICWRMMERPECSTVYPPSPGPPNDLQYTDQAKGSNNSVGALCMCNSTQNSHYTRKPEGEFCLKPSNLAGPLYNWLLTDTDCGQEYI